MGRGYKVDRGYTPSVITGVATSRQGAVTIPELKGYNNVMIALANMEIGEFSSNTDLETLLCITVYKGSYFATYCIGRESIHSASASATNIYDPTTGTFSSDKIDAGCQYVYRTLE